jgi:hypothetical protein
MNFSFDKYSYGQPELFRNNDENIKLIVGKFCSIATNVKVYISNGIGNDITFVSTYPFGNIYQDVFPNVNNLSKNTNGNVTI